MKKTVYYCDVCGKEVKDFKDLKSFILSDGFKSLPSVELCKDCFMMAETKFVDLAKFIGLENEVSSYLEFMEKF